MIPFPISADQPIAHSADLPDAADVVVIGAGVIGTSAALFLARAGKRVVLVEKGRVAGEQSSRNWGWIRVQGRDQAEIPVALEAQRLWKELAPQLDTDIGLTQGGVTYLANSDKDMARYAAWTEDSMQYQLSSKVLTMKETMALLPGAEADWYGALWTPTDMRAEPFLAVPALARLAVEEGALIREGCAARSIETEAGRISSVVTEAGEIRTSEVILAGGAWSSLFLRRHGINIPQLSVRSTAARTSALPEVFKGGAVDSRFAFRRRQDGGYTLAPAGYNELYIGPDAFRHLKTYAPIWLKDPFASSYRPIAPRDFPDAWNTARAWAADEVTPFENMRVLNPRPNMRAVERISNHFAQTYRDLPPFKIEAAWAGMIDVMPDIVPVVDRTETLPGLTIATGMCGHGFGIGPAFGRIAADLSQGRDPGHDLSRFRLSRFTDGSKLIPGPDL